MVSIETTEARSVTRRFSKPRIGFLGVGWIGRNRMEAMAKTGSAEIVGVADALEQNSREALKFAAGAEAVRSFDELLEMGLDGVVIATPSALHAEQAVQALERGVAVFCQKPLARTRKETEAVIAAARANDRLLAVDLSYRFTSGMQQIKRIASSGELGRIFAADLVFHNAYGPDKAWFYNAALSGGGCLIDLGIHLVDLAFWVLGTSEAKRACGRLFAEGRRLASPPTTVEDYATATIDLVNDTTVQLACSWRLQAGCDAAISASFYGTGGGVEFRNVNGSFYHFQAHRFQGTKSEPLAMAQEDWGGRAAVHWLTRLAEGETYDAEVESLIDVAGTLDRIYGRE